MGDWKEAYGIIAEANARKLRNSIDAQTIAQTEFRKQTSNSPIVAPYKGTADDPEKSFGEKAGEVGKSVGKRLIDILSVGTYAVNNTIDNGLDAAKSFQEGDYLKSAGQASTAALTGVTEGLLGAFGDNKDWKKTGSDNIKKYQDDFTDADSDSKASKIGQGAGGLAVDIFADPLTYATLGAAPLIKGAITGSRLGSKGVKKAVEEAAEKGKAAGMTEEQVQKQILDHPNAETYDNRLSGAIKGAGKEYKSWKASEALRKEAKADAKAFKKSGGQADSIVSELLGPNVKNAQMRRPETSFISDGSTNAVQRLSPATETTEQATRATMDFEARRALREAQEGTAEAVGKAEDQPAGIDELIGSDIDVKGKELVLANPNSTTAKLIESIQGAPVSVGKAETVSGANSKLVETLGSSRAQEIIDTLNKIQPKTRRYKQTQTRKLRAEYAARPSTITTKVSRGKRSDILTAAPVAKEASTIPVVKGKEVDLHKLIDKLMAPSLIPGKSGAWSLKNGKAKSKEALLKDLSQASAAGDMGRVKKIVEAIDPKFITDDLLGKSAKTIDEQVDEIIPDNPNEELFEEITEANPNAVTEQELIDNFGIRPEDAGRLLDEIDELVDDLDLSGRITNDSIKGIKAYIQGKHISKEDLDLLKKLTGKDTTNAVASEIATIINAHKGEINALRFGKKTKIEKSEAELQDQAASVSQLADAMAKSPQALDAAVGQQRLVREYTDTVGKITAKYNEGIGDDIVRLAEKAVDGMHAYQSKHGAKKTARGFDVNDSASKAWMRGSYNSHAGTTLHKNIIAGLKEIHAPKPLHQVDTGVKAQQYMDMLSVADAKSRAMGIQPFQSFAAGVGDSKKAINLSVYDILRELPPETLRDVLFFRGRDYGFDISQITAAVETFMRGKAAGMDNVALAKEVGEWFTKPHTKSGVGKKMQDSLGKQLESKKAAGKRDLEAFGAGFARKLINPNSTVFNNLSYRMLINSAQHASSVGKHVTDLTEPAIARISAMPTGRAFMTQMDEEIASLKKNFTPEEWELAETMLETNVQAANKLTATDRQMIDLINQASKANRSTPTKEAEVLAKADTILPNGKPEHTTYGKVKSKEVPTTPKAVHSVQAKQAKMAEDEIRATAPADAEEFAIMGAAIASDMVRKIHPIKSFFVPSLGIQGEGIYRAMNTGLHTVAHLQNNFHEQLLKHMSTYGNAALTRDFKQIQNAVVNNTGRLNLSSFESQSARDLYNVVDTLFAVSGKNVFEANSIGAEHFNALAKAANLNDSWRFNPDLKPNENAKLWAKWEGIENVPDFLSRIHNVAVRASQDIAIASSFSQKFGVIGKREGYVKIGRKPSNDASIGMFELINRDMYYPIEIARDFGAVDKLLRESRSVSGKTAMGKFVINVMDPVTNALKASQTTVRPGHWVLSVVGDTLRNHLAGVTSVTPYKQSIAVLRSGGHEMDAIGPVERYRKKATELNNAYVEGGSKGIKVNINGKFQNISNESMYRLIQNVVTLPPHSGGVMEDVLDSGTDLMKFGDLLKRGTEAVTDNKHFSLNRLASQRDNWMRTTLALDYIQKGKFKNVQEMKDGMEEFVTKWAPTSTDFTAKESKYLRRSFLYYTWLRGITPRVIETMLNKPGMTTWINKAQYNVAQANGIDPQSFGNPFPEENLYPDYYYNNILGPQWKDDMGGEWGINPSHPSVEVLNNFAGVDPLNPVQSGLGLGAALLGMSTPFAKMPLELAQGRQSTGVPIEDNSQYLLDNLGGSWISTLSRATGKTLNQNGIVDRTDSAAKNSPEEQAEHAKLQGINFLTGAQLKNYQSHEAVKSAKYGLQERLRREKEEGLR